MIVSSSHSHGLSCLPPLSFSLARAETDAQETQTEPGATMPPDAAAEAEAEHDVEGKAPLPEKSAEWDAERDAPTSQVSSTIVTDLGTGGLRLPTDDFIPFRSVAQSTGGWSDISVREMASDGRRFRSLSEARSTSPCLPIAFAWPPDCLPMASQWPPNGLPMASQWPLLPVAA